MLPGTPDTINTAIDERAAAFTTARALLPADTDGAVIMRIAEWLLTGSALLDPARVEAAAVALHALDRSSSYAYVQLDDASRARYEGQAARVVVAYLTGGNA